MNSRRIEILTDTGLKWADCGVPVFPLAIYGDQERRGPDTRSLVHNGQPDSGTDKAKISSIRRSLQRLISRLTDGSDSMMLPGVDAISDDTRPECAFTSSPVRHRSIIAHCRLTDRCSNACRRRHSFVSGGLTRRCKYNSWSPHCTSLMSAGDETAFRVNVALCVTCLVTG